MTNHIDRADYKTIQQLARRVAEICADSENQARKELWRRHNNLEKTRPMIVVEPDLWDEMVPESSLKCKNEIIRDYERQFRYIIYGWENFYDDNIYDPVVKVPLVYTITDWGFKVNRVPSPMRTGAWAYAPLMKEPSDLSKMEFPEVVVDEEKTKKNYEIVQEVIGDILPVKIHRHINIDPEVHTTFCDLRGLGQVMLDLVDRPEWVQEVMEFLTQGRLHLLKYAEKMGYLELNNTGWYWYTDDLPAKGFDGKHIRLLDLGCHGASQEFDGVSPDMFEKFLLRYQIRILELFGLNSYGCCENLTNKFDLVKQIPRLRRINVSPWTDLKVAADAIQDKYIFSWRVHPNLVSTEKFDPNYIRKDMRERLTFLKDCIVEVRLHGPRLFYNEPPKRISTWSKITRELIE